MKREIKFRVWDNKGTMVDWLTIKQTAFNRYDSENDKPDYGLMYRVFTNPDWVIMQYTGLKDRNGKEIYEGDILRMLYTDWKSKSNDDGRTLDQYLNDISLIGKVSFVGVCFVFETYSKKYDEYFQNSIYPGEHGRCEVIGNIYEHPDLLKQP